MNADLNFFAILYAHVVRACFMHAFSTLCPFNNNISVYHIYNLRFYRIFPCMCDRIHIYWIVVRIVKSARRRYFTRDTLESTHVRAFDVHVGGFNANRYNICSVRRAFDETCSVPPNAMVQFMLDE